MDGSSELRAAERALQAAIFAGDLEALDALLDDRLVHVGGDGTPQDKPTLLATRAAGRLRLTRMEEEALDVVVEGATGITRATFSLAAQTPEGFYTWQVVGTRTWARIDGRWTVLGEHVSHIDPQRPVPEPVPPAGRPRRLRAV